MDEFAQVAGQGGLAEARERDIVCGDLVGGTELIGEDCWFDPGIPQHRTAGGRPKLAVDAVEATPLARSPQRIHAQGSAEAPGRNGTIYDLHDISSTLVSLDAGVIPALRSAPRVRSASSADQDLALSRRHQFLPACPNTRPSSWTSPPRNARAPSAPMIARRRKNRNWGRGCVGISCSMARNRPSSDQHPGHLVEHCCLGPRPSARIGHKHRSRRRMSRPRTAAPSHPPEPTGCWTSRPVAAASTPAPQHPTARNPGPPPGTPRRTPSASARVTAPVPQHRSSTRLAVPDAARSARASPHRPRGIARVPRDEAVIDAGEEVVVPPAQGPSAHGRDAHRRARIRRRR